MKNVRCPHGYNFNNTTQQCDPVSKIRGREVKQYNPMIGQVPIKPNKPIGLNIGGSGLLVQQWMMDCSMDANLCQSAGHALQTLCYIQDVQGGAQPGHDSGGCENGLVSCFVPGTNIGVSCEMEAGILNYIAPNEWTVGYGSTFDGDYGSGWNGPSYPCTWTANPDWNIPAGSSNPGEFCYDSNGHPIGKHGALCGCDGVCRGYDLSNYCSYGDDFDCAPDYGNPMPCSDTQQIHTCSWPDAGFGSGEVYPGDYCLAADGHLPGKHGALCGCDGVCYPYDLSNYCTYGDIFDCVEQYGFPIPC
jgi:hypothetical protein